MNSRIIVVLVVMASVMLMGCAQSWDYPAARRDSTVDSYFGVRVEDPYRWMEDEHSPELAKWIKAENALTENYLSKIACREPLRDRLKKLMEYDSQGVYSFTGKYYFFFKKEGLRNQSVIYVKDSLSGPARLLLDPNTFSEDGTVALSDVSASRDSKYLAYSIADGGSDWNKIYVLDISTGKRLADELSWVKFSSIAWYKDGFYYSAYDAPVAGKALSGKNEYHKVYYHRVGTPQQEDRLVFQNRQEPLRNFYAQVTADEKYLIVNETAGTDGNALYVKNLRTNSEFMQLTVGYDYSYTLVGSRGDSLYMLTNYKAPRGKLICIDMNRTDVGEWIDIIEEQKDVLTDVTMAKSNFVAVHMVDAVSRMEVYALDGKKEREIEQPVMGTVGSMSGRAGTDELFYSFSSFTVPSVVYRLVPSTGEQKEVFRPELDFAFDDYVVEQVFYPSVNSQMVPMFIVHRKDIKFDGSNPTLLYGYGGFNISLTPGFSPLRLAWLEQGGVYAQACLRGGGEYGEKWHMAGTKLNKQNVFDDFIAAGEYLIRSGYTSTAKLAIQGGSNGGLLIGAVVNQRPDLFAAAIPQVGVMDMLRYQHFTIGWAWAEDYGTSDDELHFKNLYSYSPLHNIQRGENYPAILATTADHDDRVVPAHMFKYIAMMQYKQPKGAPKLVRIETRAGHGAGKPTVLRIEEQADIYAFLFENLKVHVAY